MYQHMPPSKIGVRVTIGKKIQNRTDTEEDRYPEIFRTSLVLVRRVTSAANVLSFGCSTGEEPLTLATKYFTAPDDRIVGVDVDQAVLNRARAFRAHPRITYARSSDEGLTRLGPFDAIFAMSVLCRWPETKTANDASQLFPFEHFEYSLELLASALRSGGLLCIYNANYRFTDTAVAGHFDAIRLPNVPESGFVRKFGRDGRPLADQTYDMAIFTKR